MTTCALDLERPAATADVAAVFERVYRQHGDRMVRWFFYRIEDWATAEDLASELFETLWRDMAAGRLVLDEAGHVGGLLTARARFLCLEHHRKAAARRELAWGCGQGDADKGQAEARAAAPGPESVVPQRVDVRALLNRLPPKRRVAVGLHYLEDYSVEMVAALAGVNVSVIIETLALGLRTLRQAVGADAVPDRSRSTAQRREAMRAVYTASLAEGRPLSMQELGRRFGRTGTTAKHAVADLLPAPATTRGTRARGAETTVRERLRADLAGGVFQPGQVLPSQRLAERYGAGAGYMRRVLQQLAAEGLLTKASRCYQVPRTNQGTATATVTHLDQRRATRRGAALAGLGSFTPAGVAA
jgi:RNA polymerase sigma factor (sigma-70 family)